MNRKKHKRLDDAINRRYPPMAGGPGRPLWQKWGAMFMLLGVLAFLVTVTLIKAQA